MFCSNALECPSRFTAVRPHRTVRRRFLDGLSYRDRILPMLRRGESH